MKTVKCELLYRYVGGEFNNLRLAWLVFHGSTKKKYREKNTFNNFTIVLGPSISLHPSLTIDWCYTKHMSLDCDNDIVNTEFIIISKYNIIFEGA